MSAIVVALLLAGLPAAATPARRDPAPARGASSYAQADDAAYERQPTERTFDTPEGNVRVHFDVSPELVTAADPAFAEEMGRAFEDALAHMVGVQGWARPAPDGPLGGDDRIDIYMVDMQTNGLDADGVAPTDSQDCNPARCTDQFGYVLMDNDYPDAEDAEDRSGTIRSTAVHELHHLVQATEAQLNGPWFFEMTSMWQEYVVLPQINRRLGQVEDASIAPETPLTQVGAELEALAHSYGRWPFLARLTDLYDPDVVRDAWRLSLDRDQEGLGGLSAALEQRGSTFAEEFADYAALTAAWPEVGVPADELEGQQVEWPAVERLDATDELPYSRDLVLDHTSYSVIDVPVADAVGAAIQTDSAAQVLVGLVAVIGDEAVIDLRPAVDGYTTVSLDGIGDADRLSVVVVNADPRTTGPRENPFDQATYAFDGVDISLEIAEDIGPTIGRSVQDGERVGAADPVDQAIATSQAMFADGAANRVVLATADRFPDALAGAGLAGDRGPILLTPTADILDPRVSAEIARVTGDDGVVLVLGGVGAVTAGAADQARLAAGDMACTAPLPATCRFAGETREHTAALIAQAVTDEHGSTQVLIARADDFADALTGGAYAAAAGVPLILTPSTAAGGPASAFLQANPQFTDIVVLGGEGAVSDLAADDLGATRRVAGAERTATTVAIAQGLWPSVGQVSDTAILVNVRDATAWPAALAAAVPAAILGAPQLGVESPPTGLSDSVLAYLGTGPNRGILAFGNTGLVSDAQFDQARSAAA
ncbi:MAG: cell wall-binding repeat-containing protein [Euzebya sp.]